jgi:hypothetical protein
MVSIVLYVGFAAAVSLIQGARPLLGPDHLSYIQLADSIMASCTSADYWRETDSNRSFGVLLSYLHPWTGSHILSMKIVLAVFTVLYLLSAELFFGLFSRTRWQAVLFALVSCFAVSFGVSSWGITDSTALLPRTLVAPVIMVSMWVWIRYYDRPLKYLVFPLLILASLLHLSTFYLAGVLAILEVWDFVALRGMRVDGRAFAFAGGLVLAVVLQFALESFAISSQIIGIQIPYLFRSIGIDIPNARARDASTCSRDAAQSSLEAASHAGSEPAPARLGQAGDSKSWDGIAGAKAASGVAEGGRPPEASGEETPSTAVAAADRAGRTLAVRNAKEAWAVELGLRPWRNMPLPMVNVANAVASSALILLLAMGGLITEARAGFSRVDRFMAAMLVVVPVFAFLPQTVLWGLRSVMSIYPATIEEMRAINLVMIPALYFVMRLFMRALEGGRPHRRLRATVIVFAVLALPLFMKAIPLSARERVLTAMTDLRVVDQSRPSSIVNARSALGLSTGISLYYSTQRVREWLQANTPSQARILTDRDDMILLRDKVVVGPRQTVVKAFDATLEGTQFFLQLTSAMEAKDTVRLRELAKACSADFVVVPWRADRALYVDDDFSVIAFRNE